MNRMTVDLTDLEPVDLLRAIGLTQNTSNYLERFRAAAEEVEALGYEHRTDDFIREMVQRGLTRCPCGRPECETGQRFATEAERQGIPVEEVPDYGPGFLEGLLQAITSADNGEEEDDEDEDSEPSAEEIQEMITDLETRLQEHPDLDHDYQVNPDDFVCAKCGIMDNATMLRGAVNSMLDELKDMLSLLEERESMTWLFEAVDRYASREEYVAFLRQIIAEGHDVSEHAYEFDPERPGICKHCSWIHPEAMANVRMGRTLRERIKDLIQHLETRRPRVVTIEIHIGTPPPDGDGDYF